MSANTKIEWADHTFNPWLGCTKISPACDHCYAESWAKRSGLVKWGVHEPRRRTSAHNWQQPLRWQRQAQQQGIRYRVFCASLADVFDNAVPAEWRQDLFRLIADTPNLDWLLLTKRIGNAARMITESLPATAPAWPWPHVWLGATVCNQAEADRDVPTLLKTPAMTRFLSIEPLLGAVDLQCIRPNKHDVMDALEGIGWSANGVDGTPVHFWSEAIDWVIVGGESGHHARAPQPEWVRSLREQCQRNNCLSTTPFFFKQWGGKTKDRLLDGEIWQQFPSSPAVEVLKKKRQRETP